MSSLIGQLLDRYRIDREIGQGGMGLIYQATDLQLQRLVAIKVMHSNLATVKSFRERFVQEAHAASSLEDHPHIVRVLDFSPEHLYIVMELITGGSLRDYLNMMSANGEYVGYGEAIELVSQIADALDYAHQHGMTHRDVKPENILLKPTSAKQSRLTYQAMLTDFGLAKLSESLASLTGGKPMGTFPYMSPELFEGVAVDGRVDVYALGVVLYEITVGRLPFKPQNVMEAYRMHSQEQVPPPSGFRPDYPKALTSVIMKCLAKKPDDRYDTARRLVNVLRRLQLDLNAATVTETHQDTRKTQAGLMSPPKPRPSVSPPAPVAEEDSILIEVEGQAPRIIPIRKQTMIVGRDPTKDIVLPDLYVSRSHAVLERTADGSYWIKDLGSTNPPLLGENPLRANIPEAWPFGQTLQIGTYVLRLEPGRTRKTYTLSAAAYTQVRPLEEPSHTEVVSESARLLRPLAEDAAPDDLQPIRVSMSPIHTKVHPKATIEVEVEAANDGAAADKLEIDVRGVPAAWAVVSPSVLNIAPRQHARTVLRFTPPDHWTSTAGRHTYTLRVHSTNQQMEVELITGVLHVSPFYRLAAELHPKRIYGSGAARLTLTNEGNSTINLSLQVVDPENILRIDPARIQTSIDPGQTDSLEITLQPQPDHSVHGGQLFPYEVRIQAEHGDFTTVKGELLTITDLIGQKPASPAAELPPVVADWVPAVIRVSSTNSVSRERKGCFAIWLMAYTAAAGVAFAALFALSLLLRRPENAGAENASVFMLSLAVSWVLLALSGMLLFFAWRRRQWAAYGLMLMSLPAFPIGTAAALAGWLLIRKQRRMFQ